MMFNVCHRRQQNPTLPFCNYRPPGNAKRLFVAFRARASLFVRDGVTPSFTSCPKDAQLDYKLNHRRGCVKWMWVVAINSNDGDSTSGGNESISASSIYWLK